MIKGYFQGLHPAVSFTYFAAVIGMTLACMHPVIITVILSGGGSPFWSPERNGKSSLEPCGSCFL